MTYLAAKAAGGALICYLGILACRMQYRASYVEKEQRGSFFQRSIETIQAFKVREEIADKEIADKHVDLIATLSSKKFAETSLEAAIREQTNATSYFEGYLYKTTLNVSGRQPFVYRWTDNLPVWFPFGGFISAGRTSKIVDTAAREQILKGQYTRCKLLNLYYKNREPGSYSEHGNWHYSQMEVILTGTTDCKKCDVFKKHFKRGFIKIAAGVDPKEPVDPTYPLSDTPVYKIQQGKLVQVGELASFPEADKKNLLLDKYTFCENFSYQQTRTSNGFYKELDAVVSGEENQNICRYLSMKNMQEYLASKRSGE